MGKLESDTGPLGTAELTRACAAASFSDDNESKVLRDANGDTKLLN